jgi:cyclic beta-1,2-glucan synthetase
MGRFDVESQSLSRRADAGLVSNGSFRSWLNLRGRGGAACRGVQLSRWEADRVADADGQRLYIRDRETQRWWALGEFASAGRIEAGDAGAASLAVGPGCLSFSQSGDGVGIEQTLWIDPDRPVELRRLRVCNEGRRPRRLELTTYLEITLHDALAHRSHPHFSKLFLQTEWVGSSPDRAGAMLVHRRPRALGEHHPWLVHAVLGAPVVEFESDRLLFLGRDHAPGNPFALRRAEPLSGSWGNVLDPSLSLRVHLDLDAGEARAITLLLAIGETREQALSLVAALGPEAARETSRTGAASQERSRRNHFDLCDRDAARMQTIAVAMLYGDRALRGDAALLNRVHGEPGDLASLGLDGHAPFVMLDLERAGRPNSLLESTLSAYGYWRALGLPFELCLVGADPSDRERVHGIVGEDGVHVFRSGELGAANRDRLEALAAWVVAQPHEQLRWSAFTTDESQDDEASSTRAPPEESGAKSSCAPSTPAEPLLYAHRHGGFSEDGREYVIRMRRKSDGSWSRPPRPWINVLANERFGCLISESGAGTTWSGNSRERRLSPWSNDAVLDPHGEALYLRDEEDGCFWSPLPGPAPAGGQYTMRHGFGHSRCEHRSEGLEEEVTVFVPRGDPLRLTIMRIRNLGSKPRHLSVFAHTQLVLGDRPEGSGRCIVTAFDTDRRVLLARNGMGGVYGKRIVFAALRSDVQDPWWQGSADRQQFLGLGGELSRPRLLRSGESLRPHCGAEFDPCFTLQLRFELGAGQERRICLMLGEAQQDADVVQILDRYNDCAAVDAALQNVIEFWTERLDTLQVSTPSPALDVLANGWLIYQTVACRLWARSAFYQSGGAFGFRDQLQDAVALVALWPQLARRQILLHAAHQFVEGDVLHWWHPPLSRGLRTRFVDDLLWLPHLCAHYLRCTGDVAILDGEIPFLSAPGLDPGEDERYVQPSPSGESASLYEHCCRAIDRSLQVGSHGLPLFGTGDWNDGMNRVGREGKGESVWMGFFLHTTLGEWVDLCERRGDRDRMSRYAEHRARLETALNTTGWDGEWYRRGYYDDGSPLGSKQSDECRIDALVQAWSVMSGVATPERARQAMAAVAEHLISEEEGLIRLLYPPFVDTTHDPGYIRGYVAGVRENGGQYTHAALWVVRAYAELGERLRAMRLLERIGPIHHARDDAQVDIYQVEPYVVAADIYGAPPHVGRGGWTWYTGAAGWMLRVVHETLLGITVEDGRWLRIQPRIPDLWPGFRVRMRPLGRSTIYEIEVVNPDRCAEAIVQMWLDGEEIRPTCGRARLQLDFDGRCHQVEVRLGATAG